MKSLLLTIGLLTFTLLSYSQNIYQIRADSVRIYNDCDTAEFILENHTQMVPGYLYNKGRGRTEFRRMRFIDLGLGLIAIGDQDTLNFGNALGNSFIKNQFSTAQIANYWIKGRGRVDDTLTLSLYKNNETEDSVLTTDVNGNLKMKAVAAGGDFYSSDGILNSDRYVDGDGHAIEFNNGSGFFTSGEYQGKEYGIGTYNRPLQNSGVRVTWGFNEMQVNDYAIRFAVSQQYPGSYKFLITPYGTETDQAQIDAAKIGYSSGAFVDVNPVAALDVTSSFSLPAMRLVDGNQGAGKVLTSDANGFASWQTPSGGSSLAAAASTSSVSNVSGNTTLSDSNSSVFVNNTSNTTITLPSAAANSGRIYFVKKISNNGSTVTITGSEPIDGASSYTISAVNKCVQLQSNGTAWYILTVL